MGLFCAWLPIPMQTLVAAVIALSVRVHLPISVGLVFITNPITMGPMFFFAYRLGAWFLDTEVSVDHVELSWAWLGSQLGSIWWPLLVGSLVCGWVSGVTAYIGARLGWRMRVVRRWRERRKRRRMARRTVSEM